jgi:hypothetical protein
MIGFHIKSPLDGIVHYKFPDEDWRVSVTQFGGGKAKYGNRHAHAIFSADAQGFINHPGDIAIFAQLHMALPAGQEKFTLDAEQVQALIRELKLTAHTIAKDQEQGI